MITGEGMIEAICFSIKQCVNEITSEHHMNLCTRLLEETKKSDRMTCIDDYALSIPLVPNYLYLLSYLEFIVSFEKSGKEYSFSDVVEYAQTYLVNTSNGQESVWRANSLAIGWTNGFTETLEEAILYRKEVLSMKDETYV